jgi:selenocysteine-specific elongation factor
MVDADTLEVVRLEVEDFLRGSFLESAPIVAVSSKTGAGLDELKIALAQMADEVPAKDSRAVLRLPIDRVFTMKGFGTVVTGTLIAGSVRKEEELEAYPSGKRVRVRGIQVHGAPADQAMAGQRTALNLAGVSTDDLARGMILLPPDVFRATRRLDAQLTLLPTARPLRDRARAHFHCYTAETIAEIVLLSTPDKTDQPQGTQRPQGTSRELLPGQTAWVQLRLAEPLQLLPGDRFILRQFSPVVTIGGGVVVDSAPLSEKERKQLLLPRGGRTSPTQANTGLEWATELVPQVRAVPFGANLGVDYYERLLAGTPAQVLEVRVARRAWTGLTLSDAQAETGWTRDELDAAFKTLLAGKQVLRFGDVLISAAAFTEASAGAFHEVTAFHAANPLVAGIGKEELREKLRLGPAVFGGILEALVRERKLELAGEQVRQAGRSVVMKDEESESKRQIELAFESSGLKVPALKEVLAGLKVDRARAQKIVTLLLRDRVLIKVSEDLVFHRTALDSLRRMIAAHKSKSPKIDVATFKDLTGVSRKYAIPLLEYLDRERVTRRVGDEREIL